MSGEESKTEKPTLHYFAPTVRGRAEGSRIALHAAGIAFDDLASNMGEMLGAGLLPFNQFPLLQMDGLNMSQSGAMLAYISKKGGFWPSDDKDAFMATMVINGCNDFRDKQVGAVFGSVSVEDFEGKWAPRYLGNLTKLLKDNTAKYPEADNKFIVNAKFSAADIAVFEVLDNVAGLNAALLDGYPELKAFRENFPKLNTGAAAYLEARSADGVFTYKSLSE